MLVLVLLCFAGSLAIKDISLNIKPCMVRPRFINHNPVELHYYPFISSLDRCDESCNTDEDAFGRICAPNEIEDLNVKVVNMMKRRNE